MVCCQTNANICYVSTFQSTSDLDKLIKDVNENEAPDDAPELPEELENQEGMVFSHKYG